mmetsp:Transcript_84704/g.220543  ORF Transcript_84704/g.220543 Transcript_84704/m.220543 type:complete len:608 (-) Transcript_84704:39-1862(-)
MGAAGDLEGGGANFQDLFDELDALDAKFANATVPRVSPLRGNEADPEAAVAALPQWLRVGVVLEVLEDPAVVLEACHSAGLACNDDLRRECHAAAGKTATVLAVDVVDLTVKCSIHDLGELWLPMAALSEIALGIDGCWRQGEKVHTIQDSRLYWDDGDSVAIAPAGHGGICIRIGKELYSALLDGPNRLTWSDGDVWVREEGDRFEGQANEASSSVEQSSSGNTHDRYSGRSMPAVGVEAPDPGAASERSRVTVGVEDGGQAHTGQAAMTRKRTRPGAFSSKMVAAAATVAELCAVEAEKTRKEFEEQLQQQEALEQERQRAVMEVAAAAAEERRRAQQRGSSSSSSATPSSIATAAGPLAAFPVDATAVAIEEVALRATEAPLSSEVGRIAKGQRILILGHGNAPDSRRLLVQPLDSDTQGWVSCATKGGRRLLEPPTAAPLEIGKALVVSSLQAREDVEEMDDPRAGASIEELRAEAHAVWYAFQALGEADGSSAEGRDGSWQAWVESSEQSEKGGRAAIASKRADIVEEPDEKEVTAAELRRLRLMSEERERREARGRKFADGLKKALTERGSSLQMPSTKEIGTASLSSGLFGVGSSVPRPW